MNRKTIKKYIEGQATIDEKEQVIKWIEADSKNRKEYQKLREVYDALVWIDEPTVLAKQSNQKTIYLPILKIAAVLAIIFLTNIFSYNYYIRKINREQMLTVIAPIGQYSEVVLPDSSHVWLNSNSRLQYPQNFNSSTREVFLEGEGFFKVEADPKHPFVVHTKDYAVQAIGTEFNISTIDQGAIKTSLLTGKLNIKIKHSKSKYELLPNQVFEYKNGSANYSTFTSLAYFDWRKALISIENESIEVLLKKVSHFYGLKLDIRNSRNLQDRYTGKFKTTEGIDHILKSIQVNSNFKYIRNENTLTIY